MRTLDRELLIIQAIHLADTYYMTCSQIAKYIKKNYGFKVHRSTVFRWIN